MQEGCWRPGGKPRAKASPIPRADSSQRHCCVSSEIPGLRHMRWASLSWKGTPCTATSCNMGSGSLLLGRKDVASALGLSAWLGWLLPGVATRTAFPPPASLPAAGSELRKMCQERGQGLIQDSAGSLKRLNYSSFMAVNLQPGQDKRGSFTPLICTGLSPLLLQREFPRSPRVSPEQPHLGSHQQPGVLPALSATISLCCATRCVVLIRVFPHLVQADSDMSTALSLVSSLSIAAAMLKHLKIPRKAMVPARYGCASPLPPDVARNH